MSVADVLRQGPATPDAAAATVAPMLVPDHGAGQFPCNLRGIVVLSIAVVRFRDRIRWRAVHVAGGILATVPASRLFRHTTDSGASIGVAAIDGMLATALPAAGIMARGSRGAAAARREQQ